MTLRKAVSDVVHRYWDLGLTSFGGPGVHVIILRKRFVDDHKWVDTKTFLDLFALGNALPGPGSTQLAFSIAVVKHGVLPGLTAFLLWSLPGALGMAALAVGISRIPDTLPPIVLALLTGLNAAAVGLISLAAFQLAMSSGTDGITRLLLWLSASFGICYHAPWMYPTLIAAGGLSTFVWDFRRTWTRPFGKFLRRRHPPLRTEFREEIELPELPSAAQIPIDVQNPEPCPLIKTSTVPLPSSTASANSTSSIRQRATARSDVEPAAPVSSPGPSPLKVVSVPTAVALLVGFALFVSVPLGARAGLSNAGKEVPRALDVSGEIRTLLTASSSVT
jgi:chromate transport protein ChrA